MRPTETPQNPSDPQDGARLWRQAATAFAAPDGAAQPVLDDLTLAAYLDGRLDAAGRDAVEALLAADPLACERFRAADAALGATQPLPAGLLARAARLVPDGAPAPAAAGRPGLLERLLGGGLRLKPLVLGASLAAIFMVSVVGFELGRFGYAVAEETYFPESDSLAQVADSGFVDTGF